MVKRVIAVFAALIVVTCSLVGMIFVMTPNGNDDAEPDVLNEFQEICKVPRYSGF